MHCFCSVDAQCCELLLPSHVGHVRMLVNKHSLVRDDDDKVVAEAKQVSALDAENRTVSGYLLLKLPSRSRVGIVLLVVREADHFVVVVAKDDVHTCHVDVAAHLLRGCEVSVVVGSLHNPANLADATSVIRLQKRLSHALVPKVAALLGQLNQVRRCRAQELPALVVLP